MPIVSTLVADVVPGDVVPVTKTVESTTRTATSMTLFFGDGTEEVFDLSLDPAIDLDVPV
jgi:hypothetical protein